MSDSLILVDKSDPAVPVVTINRPERRNALTLSMWRRLGAAFDELARDEAARVVVLTGAGGYFCAGADISEFKEVRSGPEDGEIYEAAVQFCGRAIESLPKATVAAISGYCIGGGFGLAQACDFRVADGTASFAVPAARLGIVYNRHECQTLLSLVGLAKAKDILFSGDRLDADQASSIGFVDRLADEGEGALGAARRFSARMSGNAPLTISGVKLILNALAAGDADRRADDIAAAGRKALESEDYQEGIRAFAEKRSPLFCGR
ncbi:MAG: 3-hydroxybutyryl-CoA dehydratase [Rhodospirillaceae bacterium]|jgi:enoyl-CoA hydratase/carnithine racemase|nr:3-hydroxybutyryl-CoA dehydratase [Rhodospirillaceae bacterium]MBT6119290.1 3-hydroxybutyryl-CoA dehydratase [Rhodospirillaceae bacterium]